jgi:hypothetical protein
MGGGVRLTTHLHVMMGLRMSGAIPSRPLYSIMVCKGTTLLYLTPEVICKD